jgi:protein-S-isoprenylcysteine O-methyltransferase Ste14
MDPELRTRVARRAFQVLILFAFLAALLFLAAGRLDWPWAWAFLGLYLAGMAANAALLLRYSPETMAQRGEAAGMRAWDRVVGGAFGLTFFIAIPLVAGLDARFGWSSLGMEAHLLGLALFVPGFALFSWAMIANAHFATVVRIGPEGAHAVCDRGPYRYVRHPGYLGAVSQSLGLPLILGSAWGLLPGILAAILLLLRTALEDRDLCRDLAGYAAYAARVRYRLMPGVW